MILGHAAIAIIGFEICRARRAFAMGAAFAIGSVLPDMDLFYWKFLSDHSMPHHLYWTHLPIFWLILGVVSTGIAALIARRCVPIVLGFLTGVALHLLLDIHAGGIALLYPYSSRMFYLFPVPNTYGNFLVSGLLHWTFLLEIPLLLVAGWMVLRAFEQHLAKRAARSSSPG